MLEKQSENDQNESTPALSRNTVFASALLLILPAGIPLFFLGQTDDPLVKGIFIATSVLMLIGNVILLFFITRWLARLAQQQPEDVSVDDVE